MRMNRWWGTALAAAVAAVAAQAQEAPKLDFTKVDAIVRSELTATNTPGAAVAVVAGDRVVFTRGYGVADVETGDAIRPEMLFRLGSTTKMITAATVVALAEQGKLDLKAPISRYITGLAPAIGGLTADQLLSHTSGLFDEAPMFGSHDDTAMKAEVLRWNNERFFAEPGEVYSYSNPGYWLAGLLAETVGGKPFADQVTDSIFTPLGMTRSTFRPTMAMTYPLAQGHDLVNGRPRVIRPAANNSASWPAGSIFSNVIDLSRWMTAFLNGGVVGGQQVLPGAVFTRLATPSAVIPGTSSRYGYGVQVGTWRGTDVVEHTGSRSGYGSIIRSFPSHKVGIVVLANRTGVTMPRTAMALAEAALAGKITSDPAPSTTPPSSPVPSLAGVYSQGGTRRTTIVAHTDGFAVRQAGADVPLLRAPAEGLVFTAGTTRYVFVTDASGAVRFLHSGGRSWKKIQ